MESSVASQWNRFLERRKHMTFFTGAERRRFATEINTRSKSLCDLAANLFVNNDEAQAAVILNAIITDASYLLKITQSQLCNKENTSE